MSEFVNIVEKYYRQEGYNCAECMIHACNEYYQLNITNDDMKLLAGFGGGMFVGSTCGALVGSIAAISKMIIRTKAHDQMEEIRPASQRVVRNFKQLEGGTTCTELKPVHHKKEQKCWETVCIAAKALEQSIQELGLDKR